MPTITDDTTSGLPADHIDVGNFRSVLDSVRGLADVAGVSAYLVGGPVRDYLLSVPLTDLDICVVGDAPALAAKLADAIGGRLTVHQRFGTASVATSDCAVDLVTARRETYRHPGALPDVTAGHLADDLARRDFTINAMAIPIAGESTELVDPHGGRADLSAGAIRILHPQSFHDDPTRILRAVRYAARFGFQMDDATLEELEAALDDKAMSTLSADRIRHELERILEEANPLPATIRASVALDGPPERLAELAESMRAAAGVDEVVIESTWIERLAAMRGVVERIAIVAALLLGVGAVLVSAASVRLAIAARLAEQEVLALVGASGRFIRRPFLYLGVLYGAGGAVVAAVLLSAALIAIEGPLARLFESYGAGLYLAGFDPMFLLALLGIGAVLGALGARLAASRPP